MKFYEKMQGISTEVCQGRKRIKKRKYQRERNHMNTDLNEKLKNTKGIIMLQKINK